MTEEKNKAFNYSNQKSNKKLDKLHVNYGHSKNNLSLASSSKMSDLKYKDERQVKLEFDEFLNNQMNEFNGNLSKKFLNQAKLFHNNAKKQPERNLINTPISPINEIKTKNENILDQYLKHFKSSFDGLENKNFVQKLDNYKEIPSNKF